MIEELSKILPRDRSLKELGDKEVYNLFTEAFFNLMDKKDSEFVKIRNIPAKIASDLRLVLVYEYFIIQNGKLWDTIIAESLQHETKRRLNANP